MANVCPTANKDTTRWPLPLLWLALAGFAFSLAFPNEVLPAPWRDHPPGIIALLALVPLLRALFSWTPGRARWAMLVFGLAGYIGTVAWARLFGQGALALVPPIGLAVLLTFFLMLAVLLWQAMRLPRIWQPLGLAAAWTGAEWLRAKGPLAFAWSELGQTQVDNPLVVLARLGGVGLLTFLIVWIVGEVALLTLPPERPASPWWRAHGLGRALVATLVLTLCAGFATVRARIRASSDPWTVVSIVQPSTLLGLKPEDLQADVSDAELQRRLGVLLDLSTQAVTAQRALPITPNRAGGMPPLIVWSESSLLDDPAYQPRIHDFVRRSGCYLLVGAPVFDMKTARVFNAASLLAPPDGRVVTRYDKVHLVPFGEYVPWRSFVEQHFIVRPFDITPGAEHAVITKTGLPLGVMICFESTFTDIAREYADRGAHLLVVMTNDAWFHNATCITGAVQMHLNHARFRAIETGLPIVRAAATGVSAFIDPYGTVHESLPLGAVGQLTARVPEGHPGTLYTVIGWLFAPACLLAALLLAALGLWKWWHERDAHATVPPSL
jgi:apolipoprotein N-acyltransferase